MSPVAIGRPEPSEYAQYFERYISKVPDGDIVELLSKQLDETLRLLGSVSESGGDYRYGPEKWSIKEVVGHMADTERIFCYRALCFARGETASLPGFDENEYVRNSNFAQRTMRDLAAELAAVRRATLALFSNLDEQSMARRGLANEREYSVRSIPYIIAGHERHHAALLRERYADGLGAAGA
jgi:uncharacterized damage-inducible protein DinB